MRLYVNKESDVPLRQQLVEQIAFFIISEKLRPGEELPSVRELARRLKIHHNTVSEAYQELRKRRWLVRKPGQQLKVRAPEAADPDSAQDIDDFINAVIRIGRGRGYSLQALRERAQQRMLASPPDHILVVEQAPGLRQLLQEELRGALGWPVQSCSASELKGNRNLVIGAQVVATQYAISDVDPLVPKDHPAIPIAFQTGDEQMQKLSQLRQPSVVAVVSVSRTFLRSWQGLFESSLGKQHTLLEFRLPLESSDALDGADLVFCDSVGMRSVTHPKRIHFRLIAPESLEYIASSMNSSQEK